MCISALCGFRSISIFRNYEKYFEKALKLRRLIATDFDNVFDKVQMLLTPTTLTSAPLYSEFMKKSNSEQCTQQDYCTQPANMAGMKYFLLVETEDFL